MRLLALDTAANLCAASVQDAGGERGRAVLDLGKGHAEHLMGVIEAALKEAGTAYGELDAIAVSVGPGSFTGVRVGVATARGLALALKIPAVGVTTLEAIAEERRIAGPDRPIIARIDAGRGQAYVAAFAADGTPTLDPAAISVDEAEALIREAGADTLLAEGKTADIGTYARVAMKRLAQDAQTASLPPRPLYLRDADAKPQGAFALPRKDAP
ncbi:MAG: tRNA (adenosine(37)-N6)-threonylcarbamoyltransferase complex dimerization subunit type 1 TsaB [Neoaquamicrobium sediminum]|uniref:tRNA (adenosine(37)-N6)-threonylcarbamoyltransferase complex dimerization subunit type 1 TsaB n=1 Tax=Neoaquamicrobium sediminum TaxID=1849104 RepID=UPI004036EF15